VGGAAEGAEKKQNRAQLSFFAFLRPSAILRYLFLFEINHPMCAVGNEILDMAQSGHQFTLLEEDPA
jgi:hypothetical protein